MPHPSDNPYAELVIQALRERGRTRTAFRGHSMEPVLVDGMILDVQSAVPRDVRVADIILYRRAEQLVVHRVMRVLRKGGAVTLMTKGDNQDYSGIDYVTEDDFVGIVRGAFSGDGIGELRKNVLADKGMAGFSYGVAGLLASFILAAKGHLPKPVRRFFGPIADAVSRKGR